MNLDEHIRWQFRYEGDFKPSYNKLKNLIKSENFDNLNEQYLINLFKDCFYGAIRTLKDYLRYEGIFQVEIREIIKEAFYTEIIDEGQTWIDLMYDIVIEENKINKTYIKNNIDKSMTCFESLVKYFEGTLSNEK